MVLHSVLLCPFVSIFIYKCMIAQNMETVKKQFLESINCSWRIKSKQHTIQA